MSNCVQSCTLSVCCSGETEYPEDMAIYGTYTVETTLDIGECGSIDEAIAMVETRMAREDIGPDDDEAVSFRPNVFEIVDDDERLVLAGDARCGRVKWCIPVISDDEAKQVAEEVSRLQTEASFEAGWDNYTTARRLRQQAQVLRGRLVDPIWRDAVLALLPAAA